MTTEDQSAVSRIDLRIAQLRRERRMLTGDRHDEISVEQALAMFAKLAPTQTRKTGGVYVEKAPLLAMAEVLTQVLNGAKRRMPIVEALASRNARRREVCS